MIHPTRQRIMKLAEDVSTERSRLARADLRKPVTTFDLAGTLILMSEMATLLSVVAADVYRVGFVPEQPE